VTNTTTPSASLGLRPASVLAVTSGKGGVGKTNVTVNVGVSLARLGYRVGILDADFGLGNVDVMLGLTPQCHIGHVLLGEKTLADIVLTGPLGIQVLPASSGLQALTTMTTSQRMRLRDVLDEFRHQLDFLLIDTAAGISDNVVETVCLAERVALVTSLEPSAVVDAYATAKVLTQASPSTEIGVVVNSVRDGDEAGLAFKQLDVAATRFLGRTLRFYGFIAEDRALRESVLVQRAVVDHLPQAVSSRCFRILASRLAGLGRGPGGLRLAVGATVSNPSTSSGPASPEVPQCA
jgi:flagellar biosynthesis protein FlhG